MKKILSILTALPLIIASCNSNSDLHETKIDEPFTNYSAQEITEKINSEDNSFLLFIYADWCPYCKTVIFGANDKTTGKDGNFTKWSEKTEYDYLTHYEREQDIEIRGSSIVKLFLTISENVNDKNKWLWEGKRYTLNNDGNEFVLHNDQQSSKDEDFQARTYIPGFIAINDGYVTGYINDDLTESQYTSFYKEFIIDNENNFLEGEKVV